MDFSKKLVDIIAEPTKEIVADAIPTETVRREDDAAISGDKQNGGGVKADKKQIELAAEINTNLVAMLLETPVHAYNNIVNYKLKRKKARKTINKPEQLEKELDRIENVYTENKAMINLDDAEFDRIKKIMLLKAEKDGGKVNESLDLWGSIISMAIKRAQIFIPD